MHSTNYYDSFIESAEDCPATTGEIPPSKGDKKTVANLQFEMVLDNPYKYTSDEVLFSVFALRKGFGKNEMKQEKEVFFSKGQPCFRASPLTKRYGWGIHSNEEGKIAMYGIDSKAYQAFLTDEKIKKTKAMRSKRK